MILLPLMLLWAPRPMQFTPSARWLLLLFFAGALTARAPDGVGVEANEQPAPRIGNAAELSREGTKVTGLAGTFQQSGRRWIFTVDEDSTSYRLLENQSLERIVRAIEEDPQDTHWKISGELTEYMDENFLLLTKSQRAP